ELSAAIGVRTDDGPVRARLRPTNLPTLTREIAPSAAEPFVRRPRSTVVLSPLVRRDLPR
ncbi:MAG TPA: hypothetical protein PKB06_12825, partial [Actinotalea sp.]|nr:hypothetical protein [Actinotalea sp.]